MSTEQLITLLLGPFGALIGAVAVIIFLWRQLQQSQAQNARQQDINARQQDLFEEALKVIREDLVPMIRDMAARRR